MFRISNLKFKAIKIYDKQLWHYSFLRKIEQIANEYDASYNKTLQPGLWVIIIQYKIRTCHRIQISSNKLTLFEPSRLFPRKPIALWGQANIKFLNYNITFDFGSQNKNIILLGYDIVYDVGIPTNSRSFDQIQNYCQLYNRKPVFWHEVGGGNLPLKFGGRGFALMTNNDERKEGVKIMKTRWHYMWTTLYSIIRPRAF